MSVVVLVAVGLFWVIVGGVAVSRRRSNEETERVDVDRGWISRSAAATRLGVSERRIAFWIACERLSETTNESGETGVTAGAVDAEHEWRRESSTTARIARTSLDVMRYVTGFPRARTP